MSEDPGKAEAQHALAATPAHGDLKPGTLFRHYKGGLYEVVCVSVAEDTLESLVTYRSLEHGYLWTRTLRNWSETVCGQPRFSPLPDHAGDLESSREDVVPCLQCDGTGWADRVHRPPGGHHDRQAVRGLQGNRLGTLHHDRHQRSGAVMIDEHGNKRLPLRFMSGSEAMAERTAAAVQPIVPGLAECLEDLKQRLLAAHGIPPHLVGNRQEPHNG